MAKPDGAIDVGDGGLTIEARDTLTYFPIIYLTPLQPDYWSISNDRQVAKMSFQLTCGAYDIVIRSTLLGGTTITGPKTAAWEDDVFTVSADYGVVDVLPIVDPPRYQATVLNADGEATMAGTNEILTMHLEMINDKDYGDENYISFGASSGWKLHDKNRSCSAYFMQNILAENCNKISYESRSVMSVPL